MSSESGVTRLFIITICVGGGNPEIIVFER